MIRKDKSSKTIGLQFGLVECFGTFAFCSGANQQLSTLVIQWRMCKTGCPQRIMVDRGIKTFFVLLTSTMSICWPCWQCCADMPRPNACRTYKKVFVCDLYQLCLVLHILHHDTYDGRQAQRRVTASKSGIMISMKMEFSCFLFLVKSMLCPKSL